MNSHSYGPVVQRALLTRELVKLRQGRKETQQVAARALKWSLSKFIRVEGGDVRLSQADLEYLLRHYNVTDEEHIKLPKRPSRRRPEARLVAGLQTAQRQGIRRLHRIRNRCQYNPNE